MAVRVCVGKPGCCGVQEKRFLLPSLLRSGLCKSLCGPGPGHLTTALEPLKELQSLVYQSAPLNPTAGHFHLLGLSLRALSCLRPEPGPPSTGWVSMVTEN